MDPQESNDTDLRARFQRLRDAEAAAAPAFAKVVATARRQAAGRDRPDRSIRVLFPVAGAVAAIALVFLFSHREKAPTPGTLAQSLPVILPPCPPSSDFLAVLVEPSLPSDPLLPFHLRIKL